MKNYLLLVNMLLFFFSSCSRQGENVGIWEGTWKLVKIEINGTVDPNYEGNVFWKYQKDVIDMVSVDEIYHERNEHLGTWSISDDNKKLTLYYNHSSESTPEGTGAYSPAPETHLPSGVILLVVESISSANMVLVWDNSVDDSRYKYIFSKFG